MNKRMTNGPGAAQPACLSRPAYRQKALATSTADGPATQSDHLLRDAAQRARKVGSGTALSDSSPRAQNCWQRGCGLDTAEHAFLALMPGFDDR